MKRAHRLTLVAACCMAVAWSAQAQSVPEPLREAARSAVNGHPSVQARWHAYQGAAHRVDVIRSGRKPTVDLDASMGRERISRPGFSSGEYTHTNITLAAGMLLFDGGATRNSIEEAEFAKLVRYYDLVDSAETIAFDTVSAYTRLARAQDVLDLAKQNYVEHKQLLDQLEEQSRAGVARGADLEQAIGRLALAEANLSTEVSVHYEAAQAYLQAVGSLPPERIPTMEPEAEITGVAYQPQEALTLALTQSPQIRAAGEGVRASQAALDQRRASRSPTVDLRTTGARDWNLDGVPGRSREVALEVRLRYALSRGGAFTAEIAQAAEALNGSRDRLDAACRSLREDLSIALNGLAVLREQTALLDTRQLTADMVKQAYQQQFNIGQRSLLDLLDTQNEFFEASRAYTQSRYDQYIAQARILSLMGQLTTAMDTSRLGLPTAADAGQDQPVMDESLLCAPELIAQIEPNIVLPEPKRDRSYVVLLENPDGTTGKVVVQGNRGVLEVQRARQTAALDGSGAAAVSDDQVARDTAASLQAAPPLPEIFVLNFQIGSTRLTPESQALLERVFGVINERPSPDVTLIGHTDTTGGAQANLRLSLRRAETVQRLLAPVASRIVAIEVQGRGETDLLVPTPDNRNEPRNRRVQITVR
jgi:outer membrane protein, adhesin transport system